MSRNYASDVACYLFVLEVLKWCLALVLGELSAWTERELCKSRPSESISPKRELQNLGSVLESRCSLKRPVLKLSDRDSRLGENGSPKQGRDGEFGPFERDFSPRREVWVLS